MTIAAFIKVKSSSGSRDLNIFFSVVLQNVHASYLVPGLAVIINSFTQIRTFDVFSARV